MIKYLLTAAIFLTIPFLYFSQDKTNNSLTDEGVSYGGMLLYDEQDKDSYEEYIGFEGKRIKEVHIKILDVAGASVQEGVERDTSWLGHIGNMFHYKTREWVIRNNLLFSAGDTLNADKLSESERLLRLSGFFLDARIRIIDFDNNKDSVSVEVITQDRWTLTFLLSYDTKNKDSYVGLRDDNLLGLGHILDATLTHDENKSVGWGTTIRYNAMNVGGSFINIGAILETNRSHDMKNISFTRPFLTTELDWMGGLSLTAENGLYEYLNTGGSIVSIPYKLKMHDVWIGKSYEPWFGSNVFRQKTRFITSVRLAGLNHTERPFVEQDSNRIFQNNTQYLFSLGIINQRFYKETYLGGFGITEDIPVGGYVVLTGGVEEREFDKRWYYGFESVYSTRIKGAGYFSGKFGIGGFRNMDKWEQNAIAADVLYHSPLIIDGKWKYRLLAESDLIYGFNRFQGEQIYLDNENGMRGFNTFSLFGTKKLTFNTEAFIFSPYEPLGFVIGGLIFADMGLIARRNEKLLTSRLYQAYGIGFRINNESIARANFEVSLVYNPYVPGSTPVRNDIKILFTGSFILGSRHFTFDRPSIINFNGAR
ncbi:MAG: hypothetical protein R6W90_01235 [Ignavibacteriaceae bacterium]